MVISDFQVEDKIGKLRFFEEIFLVTDIKFEVILRMFFLKLSNVDVSFEENTLMWKTYTTSETLSTTEQVQIIDKKEFVIAALDADSETFVVHISIWEQEEMPIYSKRQAQIEA